MKTGENKSLFGSGFHHQVYPALLASPALPSCQQAPPNHLRSVELLRFVTWYAHYQPVKCQAVSAVCALCVRANLHSLAELRQQCSVVGF